MPTRMDPDDLIGFLALLPCAFHLVFRITGHVLEVAAACAREKALWLEAIRDARRATPTTYLCA